MLRKFFAFVLSISFFGIVGASAQETGKTLQTERQFEQERLLRQRLEKEKESPQIEQKQEPVQPGAPAAEKVLIKSIKVSGATILTQDEVSSIVAEYEGKELSLAEIQKVADLITEAYRLKGYVTSRAYLPPQKILEGVLEIRVVEGLTGDIEIKGNRFFRTSLIRRGVELLKGEAFNYNDLRANLSKLNEHPDRSVRAVLVPGKEPGTTDVVLEVTDRLPMHIGFLWDNFGSRYLRKDRYSVLLKHNNLLGFDDIMTFQYQLADAQDYQLLSTRYLFPLKNNKTKLGFYASRSKLALGKEYKDVMARGKSRYYSLYAIHELVGKQDLTVSLNAGFDYLDVFNFQLTDEQSRDRLRIAKVGVDVDYADRWGGRTILSPEFDFGISSIMGGLETKDPRASRSGSGGKFVKSTVNLIRLQSMPWSTMLLWKNQAQFSPNILTASGQFQLGGISNVRGYPAGEVVGDAGYAMTLEWSVPPYFLRKGWKVPLSKATFYDALRFVGFYDFGTVQLNRPLAGEEEHETLSAYGCGLRFYLPENFSLRADFAWPIDRTPSDGNHFHPWIQVTKEF